MKIKIFSESKQVALERNVNDFIGQNDVKVLEIEYRPTMFYFSALIVYEDNDSET